MGKFICRNKNTFLQLMKSFLLMDFFVPFTTIYYLTCWNKFIQEQKLNVFFMNRQTNWRKSGIKLSQCIFIFLYQIFDPVFVIFTYFTALHWSYLTIFCIDDKTLTMTLQIPLNLVNIFFYPRKSDSVLLDQPLRDGPLGLIQHSISNSLQKMIVLVILRRMKIKGFVEGMRTW